MFARLTRAPLLGAALLGLLAAAGCRGGTGPANPAGEKRIIILNNGDSPFWDACRAGMEEAARDLKLKEAGFRAVFESNDATPQGQLDKLRQFASQSDIVAIGVSAIDGNNAAIAEQMSALRKKGVHVITIDSDVDGTKFQDA